MDKQYTLSKGMDLYGVIGTPTGYVIDGVEVCIGDVVHVPESNILNEHNNIVVMTRCSISVIGSAGTPLSKSKPDSIIVSHKEIIERGEFVGSTSLGGVGTFVVNKLIR